MLSSAWSYISDCYKKIFHLWVICFLLPSFLLMTNSEQYFYCHRFFFFCYPWIVNSIPSHKSLEENVHGQHATVCREFWNGVSRVSVNSPNILCNHFLSHLIINVHVFERKIYTKSAADTTVQWTSTPADDDDEVFQPSFIHPHFAD